MDGALVALGSDTGGSIRQPASFCGVVGMKPTYSTVSRYGLIAMASSLDQIGPFARTVGDARILFSAIAGKDPHDATTSSYAFDWQTPPLDNLKGVTIGLPKEYFLEGLNAEVKDAILRQVHEMERAGAVVQEVSLPHTEYALAIYYLVMAAEVSSNLARLDGIRYGYETRHKAENLEELYALNRGEGFGRETRRRIILGTYVLSAGYFDAYYVQASKARTLLKNDFARAFDTVDLLVTPTTPTTAFGFGEKTADPLVMYLSDIYTVSAPLAGIPALSLPVRGKGKMPIGLQLMAPHFHERQLLDVAEYVERANAVA
jgi:aspartyl-tRNA(Asn)/glutamyl-tRNA(Gln) amidotransferase subunit A